MEHAIKLDRELTEYGRGVLLTDTLSACLRKAVHLAQTGLVVSVGPVGLLEGDGEGRKQTEGSGDPESVCKARNSRLSRFVCVLCKLVKRLSILFSLMQPKHCRGTWTPVSKVTDRYGDQRT